MEPTAADLQEFKKLLALATTPYVESVLRAEISKLEGKFPQETPKPAPAKVMAPIVRYQTIDSYAFSDASDVAKVIIRNIKGLDKAVIEFTPEDHGFVITINRSEQNLPNMKLTVSPTYKKIIPADSTYKAKGETLTITLAKKKKMSWMKLKKAANDFKKTKADKAADKEKIKEDPNAALMDMMRKMYDEGDDEMKRTISKAMWEAQHKKGEDKDDLKA